MTRRPGRPRLANPIRRVITIRVTMGDFKLYKAAADKAVLTLSDWWREAADAYLDTASQAGQEQDDE